MIMHSKLIRRHTWPFELVEVVCQEVHSDPCHPHLSRGGGGSTRVHKGDNDNKANVKDVIEGQEDTPPVCHESEQDKEEDVNLNEETRLLVDMEESGSVGSHNTCTCSSKSSNVRNNHVVSFPLTTLTSSSCASNNNSDGNCVITNNCKSGHQNDGDERDKNQESLISPLLPPILLDQIGKNNFGSNCGESQKIAKKSPGFQPIHDKFNFLTKKTRDSRKKKQKEKEKERSENSSTSAASHSSSSTIKHKDFCPHSKFQQEKLLLKRNERKEGIISPSRKSETNSSVSKSNKNNEKVIRENECFTSTSSNNNSPSHSQHSSSHASQGVSLGSIGTSTQGILNKNGSSIGSGGSQSGSGLKGSVTVVTANIINCNSHNETEGKIPSANGTATGALSLQVNTANGEVKKTITLWQNYYPEGQWGWIVVFCALVVQAINHGAQLGVSTLLVKVDRRFHVGEPALLGVLASTSSCISLFFSPVWVSFCKTKSTRLSGVFGGLVASLGCLFTSFASQFHQLFFSYGAFIGVGVGLSRDASTLMVGQYFKRKREMVEIFVVSGSGIGISLMSTSFHFAITSIGWILGLQIITGGMLLTFFLGACFRSASLYHPQRRAILHLKNQKKKCLQVKDITKREDKPPFLDFSCLRSKTLQILLLSSAFIAFGINSPLFYLGMESLEAKVDELSFVLLHVYVGIAWVIGCCLFGFVAIQKNQECRVSKQYLCQVASIICGISIIAFTAVKGYSGYVVFAWVYGFSLGGYNYALKVYTYERVRARHFARAWSFVQSSQAIPIFIGTPLVNCLNQYFGRKAGYFVSAAAVFIGSAFLFLTDVRRRRLSRRKANGSSMKTCSTSDATQTPKMRRLSFAFPVEPISPHHISKPESGDGQASVLDPVLMSKELTCISEEGLAEIDFQDMYFDDWAEYLGGDCITSCNKVENCLASEYDPDISLLLDKRNRRWSRNNSIPFPGSGVGTGANISSHSHLPSPNNVNNEEDVSEQSLRASQQQPFLREIPVFRNYPWNSRQIQTQRSITVIDEASV